MIGIFFVDTTGMDAVVLQPESKAACGGMGFCGRPFFYINNFLGDQAMPQFKLPSANQLITLGITLAVLFFLLKFAPEQIKQWFRV